ncbi:hypothetical protein KEM56_001397 [Ascosphaera pollenicola]|nr:hypothetical protein KEM56_001397 [Ascosphaera pollenicola]
MPPSNWEKTKIYSKKGFDAAWNAFDKLGNPVNRLSNKIGSESFWPTTLDKESDKAARILRSFCKEGFYAQVDAEADKHKTADNGQPKGKQRILKTIPAEVIRQAKGLAIFTVMRTGLWVSGAGGSGILIARIPETGQWSPPSGIMLHTAGLGFLIGVDIYDCVVVINDYKALEAFKKVRCTLGGEVSAVAGPVGVGGVLETEVHKRQAPIWTYLKSRGFYAGVQVDGTIVIERTDENERFYGERIGVEDILAGKVRHPPYEIETLMNTVKAAQGDMDYDESLLAPPGAPADFEIEADTFAIPDPEDPDPYGVKALEQEGVVIREAGTKSIPSMDTFEFRPSEKSPIYQRWSCHESRRTSWRTSVASTSSVDRGTQTDDLPPYTASASISHTSRSSSHNFSMSPVPLDDDEGHTHSQFADAKLNNAAPKSPSASSFSRARMVIIPKRVPPPLPPRNPERFAAVMEPAKKYSYAVEEAEYSQFAESNVEGGGEEGKTKRSVSPVLSENHEMLSFPSQAEIAEGLDDERRERTGEPGPVDEDMNDRIHETVPVAANQGALNSGRNEIKEKEAERETDDDFQSIADSLDVAQDDHQHLFEPKDEANHGADLKKATEKEISDMPHRTDAGHNVDHQEAKRSSDGRVSTEFLLPLSLPETLDADDDNGDHKPNVTVEEKTEPAVSYSEQPNATHPSPAHVGQKEKAVDHKDETLKSLDNAKEKPSDNLP